MVINLKVRYLASFNYIRLILFLGLGAYFLIGCQTKEPLPILSKQTQIDGQLRYESIPAFHFVDQDSQQINLGTFEGKVYVVDFFFTSCPTICPVLAQQMLRIYQHFEHDDRVLLLSHTIDPKRDSVEKLAHYAKNLGVSSNKWHFVTGDKEAIFDIGDDYFNIILENEDAPMGLDHSGRLVLVDRDKHIRSFCNGTDPKEVDRFIKDIELLLKTYEATLD
ncbi:MAG: SCO family protein [Saprospiraceae bacterium]